VKSPRSKVLITCRGVEIEFAVETDVHLGSVEDGQVREASSKPVDLLRLLLETGGAQSPEPKPLGVVGDE
jgi:hypothetical protein